MAVYVVIWLSVAAIIYLNVVVSYCVVLSDGLNRKQKIAAVVFSWLVPVLGSCLILASVAEDIPVIRKRGPDICNLLFLSWAVALNTGQSGSGDADHVGDTDSDVNGD